MKKMAKIVRITKKALDVFTSEISNERLQELINITSQLTARDINFDINRVRRSRVTAPVSYMEILTHPAVTVCVFVLWEGSKMPMHNHPDMYGILKVLHGTVRVQSYSVAPLNNNIDNSPVQNGPVDFGWIPESVERILAKEPQLVLAKKHAAIDVSAGENVPPAVLRPQESNIHAIEPVGGPAAFLDILAPPYHEHERDCEYFQEVMTATPELNEPLVFLRSFEPKNFWSDKAEYLGPPIRHHLLAGN